MAAALLAACVSGSRSAAAQQSATVDAKKLPDPEREAKPAPNPWTFSDDGGLMILFIKPDKTGDFEAVLARIKDNLLKSDKPEQRQQAAGWKVYKARETGTGGAAMYVLVMDPVVKGADYSLGALLGEAAGAEGDPKTSMYAKYLDAFTPPAVNLLHLTAVIDFSR
jgi:hypothetical protein